MKVRFATPDDVSVFVEMARTFVEMTRFKSYTFNAERMELNLRAVVENEKGNYCFFVVENGEGNAVGGLIACVERQFFSDQLVASVVHYDVLPEYRMGGAGLKLITAFKKWAENRDVFEISAGVNSGVDLDKMDSFLRKLGFQLTGGNYSMQLGAGQ